MTSRARRYVLLVLLALVTQSLVHTPGAVAADPQPDAVSVPGSFGSEIGCPGDWQAECPQLQLTRRSDDVWSAALALPAGEFEYKVAIDKSFDVNYGLHAEPGGANIHSWCRPGAPR